MKKNSFTTEEWNAVKDEMRGILELAAKNKQIVWYSGLVSGLTTVRIELDQPDHRAVLAEFLGEISINEHEHKRPLLSSIVVKKSGVMEPGPGFFDLAESLGKLEGDKTGYWQWEVRKVFEYWETQR